MRIHLDHLVGKCASELEELYLKAFNTTMTLEISGSFSYEHSNAINLFTYLPKNITTVKLMVVITRVGHRITHYGTSGFGMGERQVVTGTSVQWSHNIGDLVAEAMKKLPKSVRKLSFVFNESPTYNDWHNMSIMNDIINSCPQNIIELDLTKAYLPPHFGNILVRFPSTLRVVKFTTQITYSSLFSLISTKCGVEEIHLDHSSFALEPQATESNLSNDAVTSSNVNKLSLNNTRLGQQSELQIAALLRVLPDTILDFDLAFTELDRKSALELQRIFRELPPNLHTLGLSNNNFSTILPQDFAISLSGIIIFIKALDLSDNGFLFLDEEPLKLILEAIPKSTVNLKLHEANLPPDITGLDLARRLKLLPEHINVFNLAGSNLFGLSIEELLVSLEGLPETITTLDLSHTNLFSKSKMDLFLFFQGIPKQIKKLILKGNPFLGIDNVSLQEIFESLAPNIIEIDLSENGIDTLFCSQFKNFIHIIPSRIRYVTLDQKQFAIQNDGALVRTSAARSCPSLFKPQIRVKHQKEFARLRLVLMQLFIKYPLPTELISYIISKVIQPVSVSEIIHWETQLTKRIISSRLPDSAGSTNCDESIAIALERIHSANVTESIFVDLSRCGLNRVQNIAMICELFGKIASKITKLSLRGNGLGQTMDTVTFTIQNLALIPSHISYVDLSENGFEFYSALQLGELFSELPATVQLVTLGQEKPLPPVMQIALRQWPDSYKKLISTSTDVLQQARALLFDYTKGDSAFLRFICFHWNRNHIDEVSRLVKLIDMGVITNVTDLLAELKLIDKHNDVGSLSRRMSFIMSLALNSVEKDPFEIDISENELEMEQLRFLT